MHAALWCGRGTMVLSNDLMRYHHFQMLAHRSFLRWKERHQIYYDFGSWEGKKRHVKLMYPDVYSRRIQRVGDFGLAIPLAKRGDENRFLDGFHEADETAPTEETYLYIHL
jgi:ribonuclease P protein 3